MRIFKKQGELSWDALLGTILSVTALLITLLMLVGIATSLYTTQSPNEKISLQTSQSIADFIDHSQDTTYENIDTCYTTFKIEHLTQYQQDKNDQKNYFFVITNSYVGAVPISQIDSFEIEELSDMSQLSHKSGFSSPVQLKEDITEEGIPIVNDNSFGFLGNSDIRLKLSNDELEYMILLPTFNNQQRYKILIPKEDVEQTAEAVLTGKNEPDDPFESSYLAYSPQTNELFAPKHKLSESFVQEKLCLKEKTQADYIDSISPDQMYDLNYKENIIEFETTPKAPYSFEWNDGPLCKKEGDAVSCDEVLESNNLGYDEFLNEIRDYIRDLDGDVSFKLSDITNTNQYERETDALDELFRFEEDRDNYFDSQGEILEEYRNDFYETSCWGVFKCEGMLYKNNKIIFSLPEVSEDELVSFNENYIRSFKINDDEYVYFFNNEEIDIKEKTITSKNSNDNEFEAYSLSFNFNEEEFTTYISKNQFRSIKSRALEIQDSFIESSSHTASEYFMEGFVKGNKVQSENVYFKKPIGDYDDALSEDQIYIYDEENLLFYERDINQDFFIEFNEDLLKKIGSGVDESWYYFSQKISFEEKTIYNFKENTLNIYCFDLSPTMFETRIFRSKNKIDVCISQQQFSSIDEEDER